VRMAGEAAPLMLMEAREPNGKGVGQGQRPQTVGQEPTRVASRRGLPKRSAEGSTGWWQIGAIEVDPLSPKQNKTPQKRGAW